MFVTPQTVTMIQAAGEEADRLDDEYVGNEHLLLALTKSQDTQAGRILRSIGVDPEGVYRALREIRGAQRSSTPSAESRYEVLEKYSVNLTDLARAGRLDPVIGRKAEIRRVIQVLARRTKNNPALIGEPGVGKTAIVEGLAQRNIQRRRAGAAAGTRRAGDRHGGDAGGGEVPRGVRGAAEGGDQRGSRGGKGQIILFFDELHQAVGAGGADGAIDAATMLKPALARGRVAGDRGDHVRRVPTARREGQGAGATVPAGTHRGAGHRGNGAGAGGHSQSLRGTPRTDDQRRGAAGRGGAVGALSDGAVSAGQGHRPDRRGGSQGAGGHLRRA